MKCNPKNRQLGVTQDFPPQLMRRYELHILPIGQNHLPMIIRLKARPYDMFGVNHSLV